MRWTLGVPRSLPRQRSEVAGHREAPRAEPPTAWEGRGRAESTAETPPGLQLTITRRWRWARLSYDVQWVRRITCIFNFYVQFMLGLSGYNPIVKLRKICIRKDVRFQLDDLSFYLKKLDKEKKMKCSANRRKKTIKIRLDNDKIENKNNREITLNQELVIWDQYSCCISSQNDADKKIRQILSILRMREVSSLQIYKYWKNIMTKVYADICSNSRNSKRLQRHKHQSSPMKKQVTQISLDLWKRLNLYLPTKKIPGMHGITDKFRQSFKEQITQIVHRLFPLNWIGRST